MGHEFDPKSAGSRSLEGKVHYLCPVYTFLIEKHWKFPLYTKNDFDLSECHEFDPRLIFLSLRLKKIEIISFLMEKHLMLLLHINIALGK